MVACTLVSMFDVGSTPLGIVAKPATGEIFLLRSLIGLNKLRLDLQGVDISRYVEETATVEFRPDTNVITRLEYRLDQSSGDVYFDNDGETKDSQSTIAAEVIVLF